MVDILYYFFYMNSLYFVFSMNSLLNAVEKDNKELYNSSLGTCIATFSLLEMQAYITFQQKTISIHKTNIYQILKQHHCRLV